jgi:hypothetical protein
MQSYLAYFEHQAERTRYGVWRAQGYFIGSGVIEAGCKNVVGRRLKQSGMFWSEPGAENLLGLRCLILGPHVDGAWEARPKIVAQSPPLAASRLGRRCLRGNYFVLHPLNSAAARSVVAKHPAPEIVNEAAPLASEVNQHETA